MKKYEVLYAVGNVLKCVGALLLLFSVTIDLDSPESSFISLFVLIAISLGCIAIGELLCNIVITEGFFLSLLILLGAVTYKWLSKSMKALEKCYQIKKRSGSYRDTFINCNRLYSDYINSLYK